MASLVLGSFSMMDPAGSSRVLAGGTSWGAPVPIEVAVNSFLQDGAIVVTQGHDNRELAIKVRFFGDDLTALGAKEKALFAELEKPNTLTWTPDSGPASVFVVVTSSLAQDDESFIGEVQARPWRSYSVRLLCEAFTRSATETVTAALAASGTTTTLVNDGSATTGWAGLFDGGASAVSVVSGAVKVGNGAAVYGVHTCSLSLTAAITTSSTKYIQIDWKTDPIYYIAPLRVFGDGVELVRMAEAVSPTAGYTRTWFGPVAASSIAVLRIDSATDVPSGGPLSAGVRSLFVDNVNRTDVKPSLGTGRQLLREIPVGGSARAPAAVAIEHASSSLGDVLAYFFNDTSVSGYSPPLSPYYNSTISGARTTDATQVSGARNQISGFNFTADVPAARLIPGMHLLMWRASNVNPITLTLNIETRINNTRIGNTTSFTIAVPAAATPAIVPLCRISLPTYDLDPTSTTALIRVAFNSGGPGNCDMDEAWLFNTDQGQLIQVACGTAAPASGGAANRVFVEPPSTIRPRPTVRIGFASDKSDAYYPTTFPAWQFPQFGPPLVSVFTVTTNALDASVSMRNFNRWHTNPGS